MKRWSIILRLLVSSGIIVYLFSIVDIRQTMKVIARSEMAFILLAFAAYIAAVVIASSRWQLLLAVQNIRIPFYKTVAYYFMGFFFNNFLPTSFGGDVVRVYKSAKLSSRRAECLTAVLMERLLGFMAIGGLAVVGLWWAADRLQNRLLTWCAIGIFLTIGVVLLLVTREQSLKWLEQITARIAWKGLNQRFAKVMGAFRVFRNRPWVLLGVFSISLVYQTAMIIFVFCLNQAINLGVGFKDFYVCVPVVAIMGMLPSINGLGVREGGWVYLFSQLGASDGSPISASAAFSFSLLVLGLGMAASLIGGVLFLLEKDKGKIEQIQYDPVKGEGEIEKTAG